MNDNIFVGMGNNPDGPELPMGFGMELAQEPKALEAFGRLSNSEKQAVIRYIQSGATGEDARRLVTEAVNRLKQGGFYG